MAKIMMAALVTVMVAPGEAVAPGNVFTVETEEEALRLEEIGAATILGGDDAPEPEVGEVDPPGGVEGEEQPPGPDGDEDPA